MNCLNICMVLIGLNGAPPTTDPPVIDSLIETLKDSDVEIRLYAGLALAQLGAPAVEPLLKALDGPDKNARAGAAYALGQLGTEALPAKPRLLKALKDNEKDVRRQAAYALSRLLTAEPATTSSTAPPPVFPEYPQK